MIKAIILDFDGTILESTNIKTEAFKQVINNYPISQIEKFIEYHKKHAGISRDIKFRFFYKCILQKPCTDEMVEKLSKQFSNIVFEKVLNCPFVPGAHKFLKSQHNKKQLFLVSGTPREELQEILTIRKMKNFFQEVFGAPTTKQEAIQNIIKKYNFLKDEMLFVGDALSDQLAAKKFKLKFIGRITQDNTKEFENIDFNIHNLMDIIKFF